MGLDYAIGSDDSVQERLAGVVADSVNHLTRDDFPNEELWIRVQKLINATTCKPARGDEGTIVATTSQMTSEEASKWLREVLSLFSEVAEASGAWNSAG